MPRYILFFCLLMNYSASVSQSYLDSLYGNSNIEGARGAYELEDSSLVFVYTRVSGKDHIRISRIKPDGELIYDNGESDTASSRRVFDFIRAPDGNFVACGHYLAADTFSFYLVKFSLSGDEIWSQIYRTQDRIAECVTVYPFLDGSYLLAGQQMIYDTGPIPGHALVIRTDSTGQQLWRKTYGVANWQEVIKSIAPTTDGGFLMAGYAIYPFGSFIEFQGLLIKTDSLGNEQWMQRYGNNNWGEAFLAIQPSLDGNFLVTGETNALSGINVGPNWILKVSGEGQILWDRNYMDGQGYNWLEDFVQLPDGSVVAAGATTGTPNGSQAGYLIKISAEGDSLWSHIYDRNPDYIDLFYSISGTMDGGFVMSGFARRPDGSSQDVWILKVDSLGCAVPGCFAVDVEEPPVVSTGKLEVWPNPFDALLRVRLPGPTGSAPARLRLYALSGQLLWEQALPPGAIETQAYLGMLPPGAYFLMYEREGAPPVGAKVVKVR